MYSSAFKKLIEVVVMTKMHFRILGGVVILINLFLIGENKIEGAMILVLTLGVAVFVELILIKNFASDRVENLQE